MSTTRSTASAKPAPLADLTAYLHPTVASKPASRSRSGYRRAGMRGCAGVGLVDTTVGFLIFLILLMFSAQVLVRLYASSTLSSAASHAAEEVAYSPYPPAEVAIAEADARRQLGSFGGSRTTFDWGPLNGDVVVLKVIARAPSFVPFTGAWATITRTVSVRIERFR